MYDIYNRTPSPNLVNALRLHLQGVRGDRRFAAALLPHGTIKHSFVAPPGAPQPRTTDPGRPR